MRQNLTPLLLETLPYRRMRGQRLKSGGVERID
jgi:hypothetical protein